MLVWLVKLLLFNVVVPFEYIILQKQKKKKNILKKALNFFIFMLYFVWRLNGVSDLFVIVQNNHANGKKKNFKVNFAIALVQTTLIHTC